MKNKDKREYEKALNLYNNGYIDKAIETCELGISRNLGDSNLLNLKGLLLYLKGDLEEAISLWKINKYHNNDDIAKAYLKDIQRDFNRRDLFKDAEELIRNLNIDEALEILKVCKESDFNSISVNNALSICYMKKAQYIECREYIDKVFLLDKYNIDAKSIKKEIDEILNINNKRIVVKSIILTAIIFIIITSGILIRGRFQGEYKNNTDDYLGIVNENIAVNNLENSLITIDDNKEESNIKIENKDNNSDKQTLDQDQIRENYIKATNLFDEENYDNARDILEQTVLYSEKNHLNDDITFLLASVNEKLGDNNEAIKYFEKYISVYENGNYIEESYYKVSLLYKGLNKEKSKYYAEELVNKFPNSIYNNTNIKDILNN